MPQANAERTVFILLSTAGGLALQSGNNVDNEAIGLGADEVVGDAYFDTIGAVNRYTSTVGLSGQGWMVQSLLVDAAGWEHFLNGTSIDSGADVLATGSDFLTVGGSLVGAELADMSVAAILIYDSALSEGDRLDVLDYLQVKYGISF